MREHSPHSAELIHIKIDDRAIELPARQHTRLVLADDLYAVAQRKALVRIIGNGSVERSMSDGDAR